MFELFIKLVEIDWFSNLNQMEFSTLNIVNFLSGLIRQSFKTLMIFNAHSSSIQLNKGKKGEFNSKNIYCFK
jgi:hypothetical protein